MTVSAASVTEYGGFELALGSVFAVRWFRPDQYGRLHAVNHKFVWKPGENVARCQREEGGWFTTGLSFNILGYSSSTNVIVAEEEVAKDNCSCGFYAFAEGCDDGGYFTEGGVRGVIECYGRTILGTRGLRCEKARVVAVTTDRQDIRRNYPDVQFFSPPVKRRFRRQQPTHARMLAAFDLVQPYTPTPDDPDFWERP